MSFIYDDKDLINKLINSAIEFENRFSKKAQIKETNAPFTPMKNTGDVSGEKARAGIALRLLDSIEQTMSKSGNVTSNVGNADLTSPDLENLGALLNFIVKNQIMVNYRRIAYDVSETKPDDSYKLQNAETNPFFAQIGYHSQGFFVNPDLLHEYLLSLLATANEKQIATMQVQLKSLISESNSKLGLKTNPSGEDKKDEEEDLKNARYFKNAPPTPTSGAAATEKSIADVISELPLHPQHVDINKIQRFLDAYKQLAGNSTYAASALSNIQAAEADIREVQKYSSTASPFPLGADVDQADVMTFIDKANKQTSYASFLSALYQLVMSTANVIRHFSTIFALYLKKHTDFLNEVNYQIGPGTSYIYDNKTDLKRLMNTPLPQTGPRR